ncbi:MULTISPECIES: hypothetical protein [Exiguobacterium]|uniref:hypothetical protein n=1 Tax=Exiguobacterium TaxID=33986 RepID=UPI001AE627DB|nr:MULTISPECIES: hypothetical protein [Exiguobacterium]MCT4779841.1 hypothetical protein [Exiguobacterium soli]
MITILILLAIVWISAIGLSDLKNSEPKRQYVAIFCPSCHTELFSNGETLHDGEILIKRCKVCHTVSNWHLAIAPVPLLLNRPLKSNVDLYREEETE